MPTDPIRLGQSGALAGANTLEFGFDLWSYGITETGTAAEIEARCATLQASGWVGTAEPINGGPRYMLRARYAGSSNPSTPDAAIQTTWDLETQYDNVAAIESKKYRDYRDSIAVDHQDKGVIDYKMTIPNPSDIDDYTSWPETRTLWYIAIREGMAVREPHPVLTKTKIYPYGTAATADWSDTNKVWTTAQITAVETIPARLGTIPTKKWFKCDPHVSYGVDGRVMMTTRWIAGDYPSHMYDFKT